MDFISLPEDRKITFLDRCLHAYYAFRMQVKPDVARVLKEIERMQQKADEVQLTLDEKRDAAMVTLQGYEKACIESIHGGTENWRELFDNVMLYVDGLSVEDQLTIMRYMFAGNRYICTTLRFRQWMARHAEAILDHISE